MGERKGELEPICTKTTHRGKAGRDDPAPGSKTIVPISQRLLLAPKKLFAFLGGGSTLFVISLVVFSLSGFPGAARAGFFASLLKFLAAPPAVVEEAADAAIGAGRSAEPELPALEANPAMAGVEPASSADSPSRLPLVQDSALLAPRNPLGTTPSAAGPPQGQIFIYTVRPGDTLSSIADAFDVSQNTILWANRIANPRNLRVGSEILILPISGVRHVVEKNDSIEKIAKRYRASQDEIASFNGLAPGEVLAVGQTLVVPGGELPFSAPIAGVSRTAQSFLRLPEYSGFYARPIVGGRRSRGLHGFNGVDLASTCGGPVMAAAEGTVIVARLSGWNGGYGRYLVITHSNSTQTLYAHLKELLVWTGQVVTQGTPIATIGSSGNSTGCHVHFEVRGARNPF